MAGTPRFKVYDSHGTYRASVKEVESGACLMGMYGDGATIRYGHNIIVWTQGKDGDATSSYDDVAERVHAMLEARSTVMRIRHEVERA